MNATIYPEKIPWGLAELLIFPFSLLVRPNSTQTRTFAMEELKNIIRKVWKTYFAKYMFKPYFSLLLKESPLAAITPLWYMTLLKVWKQTEERKTGRRKSQEDAFFIFLEWRLNRERGELIIWRRVFEITKLYNTKWYWDETLRLNIIK